MKKIELTASEIETLKDYLWCNPCAATCICEYKKINCDDMKNGEYKCRLKRDTESIWKKISEQ